MHDSVIHSLDELAAYTKEHGKEAKWRDELGYQRKESEILHVMFL